MNIICKKYEIGCPCHLSIDANVITYCKKTSASWVGFSRFLPINRLPYLLTHINCQSNSLNTAHRQRRLTEFTKTTSGLGMVCYHTTCKDVIKRLQLKLMIHHVLEC